MSSSLFWDVTQRIMVGSCRHVDPKRPYLTVTLRCITYQKSEDLRIFLPELVQL
jgi:hypothetical protein